MAAYASLVSLSHILHHIQNPPPLNEIVIEKQQIEHLQEMVYFSIDFLETYSSRRSKEIQKLENHIAIAVYAAEDIIESHVVGKIHPEKKSSRPFGQSVQKAIEKFLPRVDIQKVIKEFVLIQKKMEKIKNSRHMEDVRAVGSTGGSSSRSLPSGKNIMVGFDKHLNEVMAALATDGYNRQIVPIVGMGGIGKTTLATAVYKDAYIVERFEFRAWVSASLEYGEREIVYSLLHQVNSNVEEGADELGILLHKSLFGRRYLIVLDDMWDIQAWERLKNFLPESNNGSRVLVTTRLLNLALDFGSCSPYQIGLLDEEKSWDLIVEKVFAKEKCPDELEGIGKRIASKCGGLPLALVVIGGLLANSVKTREFWLHVEEDVTAAASSEDDKRCIKILSLSYTHLPVHLKPCFLYLAIFPKNVEIRVSRLIRLWVAEGFIKLPSTDKSLEELAEEYLGDLFDRNLIMVGQQGCSGKVKVIGIHDLIRGLCLGEAHKNKFLCIINLDNPKIKKPHIKSERRLGVHVGTRKEKVIKVLRSSKLIRSSLSFSYWESRRCIARWPNLLRVLDVVDYYPMDDILRLINSRYITCAISRDLHNVSSFIARLWNLQTLIVSGCISLPPEIWQMPQLRHLKIDRITLPDPPDAGVDSQSIQVLENLQTLSTINGFIFRDLVLRKIPNLKKLGISCRITEQIESFCLTNLVSLRQLESLAIAFDGTWRDMAFPISVKKLTLSYCRIPWDDMSAVGSLPKLEVLKLQSYAATGRIWKPHEGEFRRLKFLLIDSCQLEIWGAEASHFPILEQLHLKSLELKEIPMDFAEIPTLQMINMNYCRSSLFISSKEMSKERKDLGFENIQVRSFPSESRIQILDNVVGFEDEANTIIKYLSEESEQLEVISIVGMPGLGKTTLAWKIYCDARIKFAFPILIWVYVSQDFSSRNVFVTILKKFVSRWNEKEVSTSVLAKFIKSCLKNEHFVLFLDDVWTVDDWKLIETALPKSNTRGKVLITSRDEKVARQANPRRDPHMLRFLTPDEHWLLFQQVVFGELDECPSELEVLGKQLVDQCGGVPLAILVVGGILAKSISTGYDRKDEWENILRSLSTCVGNDGQKCIEHIILLSYNKLPHDLRDCFLYMGVFPSETEIPAWKLIRLWIAEGFIKQKPDNSLEEVAEENLKDLINRNLVMVAKAKANGGVKTCRIHYIVREFCKSQAAFAKQNLFQEVKKSEEGVFNPPISKMPNLRRLCIHFDVEEFLQRETKGSGIQSFLCFSKEEIIVPSEHVQTIPKSYNLLRVLDISPIKFINFPTKLTQLINLSYIALSDDDFEGLPEAASDLWNLQTIRIDTTWHTFEIKANIWKMMQLRHLKTKAAIFLNKEEGEAGENLQSLSRISVECCTEDLLNRAPKLKNLGIRGQLEHLQVGKFLQNLDHLQKLKLVNNGYPPHYLKLYQGFQSESSLLYLPKPNRFPPNLKILTLSTTIIDSYGMTKLGMIRSLEVLQLKKITFPERELAVITGGFPSLQVLHIACTDLEFLIAEGDPFPKLKHLVLKYCWKLEEIPSVLEKSIQILEIEGASQSLLACSSRIQREKQQLQQQNRARKDGFKLIIW